MKTRIQLNSDYLWIIKVNKFSVEKKINFFFFPLALGLLDYPQIIKTPMDLSTVKKNLKNNKYKYVEETLHDIQMIWDNCKTYNAEASVILKLREQNLMICYF